MNQPKTLYKRISRGFWNYALFPKTIDIDELIYQYGESKDYYESIYDYKVEHYHNHINGIKKACQLLDIPFDQNRLLDVTRAIVLGCKSNPKASEIKNLISVAGIKDITTTKLVFDFDSTDLSLAQKDTISLCTRLLNASVPKDCIQICFSGNKGFSIEVETDQSFTRSEFENIINNLSHGLNTFDSAVKDEQRLFRIPLTCHHGSGLYKIPITLNQLSKLPIEMILDMARPEVVRANTEKYVAIMNSWGMAITPNKINELKKLTAEEKKTIDESISFDDRLDITNKPPWMSAARYALHLGFFREGQRNTAFMILASTYKSHGHPPEVAWRMLKGVAELQAKRTGGEEYDDQKLWKEVIEVVYSDSWRGGTYSEKETKLLKEIRETFSLDDNDRERKLINIYEVSEQFKLFGQQIDKNTIKTGIKEIDENVLITTGMMVGLLGAPSAGKTSIANAFVRHLSMNDQYVLFESLDMSNHLLFTRFLQKYSGLGMKEILNQIKTNDISERLLNSFQRVHQDYKNVNFNFRSGTNVDDIENDIIEYKNKYGDLKLVVVDYLEKVRGPYSDPTSNGAYVASRLSDLAREHNICLLLLLQPQKSAGDPSEPLLSMRKVKGASVIEQDSRVILTMWRPGFNPKTMEKDKFASIAVVKNNMGVLGQYDFSWDGIAGELTTLTPDQAQELEWLNDELAAQKAVDNGF